jgi:UDP-N-acetylglucosamine--N-acetylmuramyl-(pentapeptide) pyrophosphoryl-undecaprenol N-acetylglucosamine transferase
MLVTGGHLTPAVALIDEVKRVHPDWKIVFVGRPHALEKGTVPSEEERVTTSRGVTFVPLVTGRGSIVYFWKVLAGIVRARAIIARTKPTIIMSFGGYVGLPIVVAAWMRGIPVVTHEQTRVTGLANRVIAGIARRVCVSFPDQKGTYTGLPIRRVVFNPPASSSLPIPDGTKRILYVTGGTTGAVSLNDILYGALEKLLPTSVVVHQVGRFSLTKARDVRAGLPPPLKRKYIVLPYIDEADHAWLLGHADLLISRAGANTVGEMAAVGAVGILVPLPWSAGGEQQANAAWLAGQGSAKVLSQDALDAGLLREAVEDMLAHLPKLRKAASTIAATYPQDGATRLLHEIEAAVL